MSTALEIITDAYREGNINGIGVTPDANQTTEGLRRLNALISSALGFEIGEGLSDWMVGRTNIVDTWNPVDVGPGWCQEQWMRPHTNVRLLLNSQSPETIYLPSRVDDGARIQAIDILGTLATYPVTLDGNGLRIESASSVVLNTNNLTKTWMYRADLATWVVVTPIAADDEMPFPPEFDDAFITWLAMRLNPRYGRSMDQQSQATLQTSQTKLKSRYKQSQIVPADPGVTRLTRTGYGHQGITGRGRFGWMS